MPVVREYRAKQGSHLSDKAASAIGTYLDRKFNGEIITASDVIDAARPVRSPIHPFITWDDKTAAHLRRLDEARKVMHSIMVVERVEDEPVLTRAYHLVARVTEEGVEQGYVTERVVWRNDDYAVQVIERAKREFVAWRDRHSMYTELMEWARQELNG